MTAPGVRVEPVRSRKFPGAERHWRGDVLIAAHCVDCQRLTPAEELRTDRTSPAGRMLMCLDCSRAAAAAYRATPTGAAKVRKYSRRSVAERRQAKARRL